MTRNEAYKSISLLKTRHGYDVREDERKHFVDHKFSDSSVCFFIELVKGHVERRDSVKILEH